MVSSPEPRRWHDVLRSGEPWMTLMNLGEVTYIVEREHSAEAVEELWANLRARCAPGGGQSIRWLDGDETRVRTAARSRPVGIPATPILRCGRGRILGCPVLTGDREFVTLEAARIVVHWLLSPV